MTLLAQYFHLQCASSQLNFRSNDRELIMSVCRKIFKDKIFPQKFPNLS